MNVELHSRLMKASVLAAIFGGVALMWTASGALPGAARTSAAIGKFHRVAEPATVKNRPATFFFMSALFCPYCAAERWAIVEALGRFGTWNGLRPATSTGGIDGFTALPTYDFFHASYESPFVRFTHTDVADAAGRPLQHLSVAETNVVNRYDPHGGIPFLLIDGAFVQLDSGYSPGLLANKTFVQMRVAIRHETALGRTIEQEANVLSALICIGNGERPAKVCTAPAVRGLIALAR